MKVLCSIKSIVEYTHWQNKCIIILNGCRILRIQKIILESRKKYYMPVCKILQSRKTFLHARKCIFEKKLYACLHVHV
jgi:hypothetical protein